MKNLKSKIGSHLVKQLDRYRCYRQRVRVVATTRDKQNVVRDYTFIAVPRTLEKVEYDVRIKRKPRGGANVEKLERVWSRAELVDFVHKMA